VLAKKEKTVITSKTNKAKDKAIKNAKRLKKEN
jgi:hypothetical protein